MAVQGCVPTSGGQLVAAPDQEHNKRRITYFYGQKCNHAICYCHLNKSRGVSKENKTNIDEVLP